MLPVKMGADVFEYDSAVQVGSHYSGMRIFPQIPSDHRFYFLSRPIDKQLWLPRAAVNQANAFSIFAPMAQRNTLIRISGKDGAGKEITSEYECDASQGLRMSFPPKFKLYNFKKNTHTHPRWTCSSTVQFITDSIGVDRARAGR